MENNKRKNILFIMFGIIILTLVFIIYLLISNNRGNIKEDYNRLEIGKDTETISSVNKEVVNDDSKSDTPEGEIVDDTVIVDNNEIDSNTNIANYSEEDVISYFEGNEKEIRNSSFKEKFKEYFIEMVDFIFYGTEIKGYTFNELTNTGKLKVISAALKIDSLIEDKSHGYKESIKSVGSRVYTNAKEKLTELFLNIATNVCKDKEDDCDKAKELFGDIKSTCKIGWSFIKELLKNGRNKLKDWYEIYSGK